MKRAGEPVCEPGQAHIANYAKACCWHTRKKLLVLGRVAHSAPSTLIWPLLLLALLLSLGVWGVTKVVAADKNNAKSQASSTATEVSALCTQRVAMGAVPVKLMSALVTYSPQYRDANELFTALGPALIEQTTPDTLGVQLLPNGVVSSVFPGNASGVGHDVFASQGDRYGAIKAARDRILTLDGPKGSADRGYTVVVRDPIYIRNVDANETFGIPRPLNPSCGDPCAYNETLRTRFWGFTAVTVSLAYLNTPYSPLNSLIGRGYDYALLAPNATTGAMDVLVTSRPSGLPADAVEVPVMLFNTMWFLRVIPMDGWTPAWYGGMLAGVIVLALALSLLLLSVLLSRRQHQLLLKAVLPKEVIREMQQEAAPAVKALNADTPADMLLNMMGELLEGYMPDMRDVVFIRTALMRNMDIYRPLNLRKHLRGSSLDADVVKALMRQLGNGGDLDGASTSDGLHADDPGGERPAVGRDSCASAAPQEACDTLGGTLTLLLNVQPISTFHIMADAADVAVHSYWGLRDEAGPAGPGLATSTSGELGERPTFHKHRGKKMPVSLSANGRPSPTGSLQLQLQQQQQQVTVPLSVIEESETVLAGVDDWQFDTWALQKATQGHALSTLGFFLITRSGLAQRFKIKAVTLARLLRQVEAGYLDNPYHNSVHAADVLQTLHVLLHAAQLHVHYLDQLGLLAAYYAAIVHDYGHPGLTSDFLVATSDPLAIRYNDRSPLENHHCAASFALLRRPELDAFAPLSAPERASLRRQVIELVLATDMKQHFSIISHFNTVHRLTSYSQQQAAAALAPSNSLARAVSLRPGTANGDAKRSVLRPSLPQPQQAAAPRPVDETERLLSLQVALKCADVGHLGEALGVHQRWLGALEEEFFRQGDRERELGLPISPLFDRAKQGVSKSQVGFYDFVALPLVHALGSAFPGAQPLVHCFLGNYNHWRVVDGQPPVGLQKAKSGNRLVDATAQLTKVMSGKALDPPARTPTLSKPQPAPPVLPTPGDHVPEDPAVELSLSGE